MADLDTLNIRVSADASNATTSIDKLSNSIKNLNSQMSSLRADSLADFAPGLKGLAEGMKSLEGLSKTDFNKLTAWLKELGKADTTTIADVAIAINSLGKAFQGINSVGTVATSLASFTKALGDLGSAKVERAITYIPQLTQAIQQMLVTLSQAPSVNGNITKLISAIGSLANQGQKVGTASRGMYNAFSQNASVFSKFNIKAVSLSAILGKIYSDLWLVIRATKMLGKAVKSAMAYGETLNYFDRAFDDIASKAVKEMEDAGKDSAEAYFNSFKENALKVSGVLTGITSNGKGIQLVDGKNLGLNANDTLKFQTQFAQISSSMGVASDNASRLSEVMIKLGGDLGSIKDEDFSTTWQKMSSGLVGMSRTMDAYGVNIRNANLNQTLLDLGIDTTVDKLGQEDKVLLRTITILNATKYAWGDLSNTIDSNANMLRVLQANWQKLSMIIGSMFANALKRLLPIINGVMVALQRLALFVANLFGIDADFGSSFGSGFEDAYDAMGDLADETATATGNAKKLKNQLLGLDELNVITTPDSSSGGGGIGGGAGSGLLDNAFLEATEDYLKEWQKAFDKMEDKVNKFADRISELLQPVRDLFSDIKNGDWNAVGGDLSNIFTMTVDGVTDLIKKVDWEKVGENVGEFLKGIKFTKIILSIADLIDSIFFGALELWSSSLKEAPIETLLISTIGVMSFTTAGRAIAGQLFLAIGAGLAGLSYGKLLGTYLFPEDEEYYASFKISDLTIIFEDPKVTYKGLELMRKENPIVYALFKESGLLLPFIAVIETKNILGVVNKVISSINKVVGNFITELIVKIGDLPAKLLTALNLWGTLETIETDIRTFFDLLKIDVNLAFAYIATRIIQVFSKDNVTNNLNGMKTGFSGVLATVGINTSTSLANILDSIRTWFSSDKVKEKLSGITSGFTAVMNTAKSIVELIANAIKNVINAIFGTSTNFNFDGIKNGLINAVNSAVSTASSALDGLISKLNQVNGGAIVNATVELATMGAQILEQAKVPGTTTKPKNNTSGDERSQAKGTVNSASDYLKLKNAGKFAGGGIPQVGSLFWAGEAGPELVGTIGNSNTTAVASNGEITGISDTIRATSSAEMQLLRQQNELLMQIVAKPMGITESELFNSVRKSANNYTKMTGNLAF